MAATRAPGFSGPRRNPSTRSFRSGVSRACRRSSCMITQAAAASGARNRFAAKLERLARSIRIPCSSSLTRFSTFPRRQWIRSQRRCGLPPALVTA